MHHECIVHAYTSVDVHNSTLLVRKRVRKVLESSALNVNNPCRLHLKKIYKKTTSSVCYKAKRRFRFQVFHAVEQMGVCYVKHVVTQCLRR